MNVEKFVRSRCHWILLLLCVTLTSVFLTESELWLNSIPHRQLHIISSHNHHPKNSNHDIKNYGDSGQQNVDHDEVPEGDDFIVDVMIGLTTSNDIQDQGIQRHKKLRAKKQSRFPKRKLLEGFSPKNVPSEEMFYQLSKDKVSPYNFTCVINAEFSCHGDIADGQDVLVIVAVLSAPAHHKERQAIRETWGNFSQTLRTVNGTRVKMRTLFFMGLSSPLVNKAVLAESSEHGDIIVDDFVDSYKNLSTKTVMLLHWVTRHCAGRPNIYMVKSDDDMMIHPTLLLNTIEAQPRHNVLFGARVGGNKVSRLGRWEIPVKEYPFPQLPAYLAGNLYVMTTDIAVQLFRASEYFHRICLEDVYVTGVLARLAGVHSYGLPAFPIWLTSGPTCLCELLEGRWVAVHRVSIDSLHTYWHKLTSGITC